MKRYKILLSLYLCSLSIIACQNSIENHQQRDRTLAKENRKNVTGNNLPNPLESQAFRTVEEVNHPDHDFTHFMISQHALAIELANEELKSGNDKKMKTVAAHIVQHHQLEKDFLEKAANRIDLTESQQQDQSSSIMHLPLKSAYDKMQKLETDPKQDVDLTFKNKIINHHQTSMEVAEVYINFGKDKELVDYAKRLVQDHQQEVKQLQQ